MVLRRTLRVLSVCFLMLVGSGPPAATWYVDGSVARAGDGTSWEKALKRIQAGIDKAANGDTVVVAQGTYVENVKFAGKSIVLTSTDPRDWDIVARTIIDGSKAGSVIQFSGTEDQTCVLSGFTIRNGEGSLYDMPLGRRGGGGGVLGSTAAPPGTRATIEYNIITANSAVQNGGGVAYAWGVLRHNIIYGNSTGTCGGGTSACGGIIEGNVIVGNTSGALGGGVSHCNGSIRNNVVVANYAASYGGGLAHCGTSQYPPPGGSVTNCIVWGNTSPTGPQAQASVTPTYCCIQDWSEGGEGNRSGDPRFVDPDGRDDDPNTFQDNDYRLSPTSPCIDAGINEDWMNGAVDLDGKPRILLGATSLTVDMGAYEYRFDLAIGRNAGSDVQLSWTMGPLRSYTVFSSSGLTGQAWTEETTILGGKTGGPALWVDPAPTSVLKFYKIEIE